MSHSNENIYLELTRHFNKGALRAIISSGQAVVLHRLAIMSKDGDWIVRENAKDLLDKERRLLMRADETRLVAYSVAAQKWLARWPSLQPSLQTMPLDDAHLKLLQAAEGVLPLHP